MLRNVKARNLPRKFIKLGRKSNSTIQFPTASLCKFIAPTFVILTSRDRESVGLHVFEKSECQPLQEAHFGIPCVETPKSESTNNRSALENPNFCQPLTVWRLIEGENGSFRTGGQFSIVEAV